MENRTTPSRCATPVPLLVAKSNRPVILEVNVLHMRIAPLQFFLVFGLVACSSGSPSNGDTSTGSGGNGLVGGSGPAAGGGPATGGAAAGGAIQTGGMASTGGASPSLNGGSPGTGGARPSGGAGLMTGGQASGTGGMSASSAPTTGGRSTATTGGTQPIGGTTTAGGRTATGGISTTSSGFGTGGASGTGGATGTGATPGGIPTCPTISASTSGGPPALSAVPSPEQATLQHLEMTAFLHFGLDTFDGTEQGDMAMTRPRRSIRRISPRTR